MPLPSGASFESVMARPCLLPLSTLPCQPFTVTPPPATFLSASYRPRSAGMDGIALIISHPAPATIEAFARRIDFLLQTRARLKLRLLCRGRCCRQVFYFGGLTTLSTVDLRLLR